MNTVLEASHERHYCQEARARSERAKTKAPGESRKGNGPVQKISRSRCRQKRIELAPLAKFFARKALKKDWAAFSITVYAVLVLEGSVFLWPVQ